MSYQCQLGGSKWDAVAFVRQKTEDTATPYVVPDAAYTTYVEDVAEDFSRYVPLITQIGNVYTVSSPLSTVTGQQRYVCNAANGFTSAPDAIVDVLYRATGGYSAAAEIGYFALLPFSPVNAFLLTPALLDSPANRFIRDQYFDELDHYGKGFAGIIRDPATGLLAFDLYPVPNVTGTPIYVRYRTSHQSTAVSDGFGSVLYSTVPENYKRHFARLLYAAVLEQEAERLSRLNRAQDGQVVSQGDPGSLRMLAEDVREKTYQQLGGTTPAVLALSN